MEHRGAGCVAQHDMALRRDTVLRKLGWPMAEGRLDPAAAA